MSNFFLDPVNGNDANDGTTFANRWKTITSGATAARIAPSDIIRIIKSYDPASLGNATWTNASATVTLAGAATQNIYLDGAWTASANVTCTTSTTRKEGATSSNVAIAAAFTTGLAAYFATGSLNLSSYQQISFYIRQSAGTLVSNAAWVSISLCSDTVGAVPVNTISVPILGALNTWHVFTVDTGGALGSSIQSIALTINTDNGAQTFQIDNVIACKAPGVGLTLSSLIGKNTGSEGWWSIRSINGTTVILEDNTNTSAAAASSALYQGSTATVTTYALDALTVPSMASIAVTWGQVQDGGSDLGSNAIKFSGGWDRTNMSTQTGVSYITTPNGLGLGLDCSSQPCIIFEKVAFSRFERYLLTSPRSQLQFEQINCSVQTVGTTTAVIQVSGASLTLPSTLTITNVLACNCGAGGVASIISYGAGIAGLTTTITNIDACTLASTAGASAGILVINQCNNTQTSIVNIRPSAALNGYIAITGGQYNQITITGVMKEIAGSSGLYVGGLTNTFDLSSATSFTNTGGFVGANVAGGCNILMGSLSTGGPISGGNFFGGTFTGTITPSTSSPISFNGSDISGATIGTVTSNLIVQKQAGSLTDNRTYTPQGNVTSDVTTRHTASGISWKFAPAATLGVGPYAPLQVPIASIAVNASTLVTVNVYAYRSSTDLNIGMRVLGNRVGGVSQATVFCSAAINTWQQITLTFTPSETGVVEIVGLAYQTTTGAAGEVGYLDDMTITQA